MIALSLILATLADDREELAQAAARLADAASYTFKAETQVESPLGGAGNQIPLIEGKYKKDVGVHASVADRGEFFRTGEKLFVKLGDGEWQPIESAQPRPGGTTPEGGGGLLRRARGPLLQRLFRNVKAPHEELKDLAKAFKEVKKDEAKDKVAGKDCTVYQGELSDEGVQKTPLGRLLGQFPGGANASTAGSAKAWVDAEGNLLRYEVTTRATVEFQGNSVDFSLVRTLDLSDVGKTEVAVPEAVKKLLETPPAAPEKKREDF